MNCSLIVSCVTWGISSVLEANICVNLYFLYYSFSYFFLLINSRRVLAMVTVFLVQLYKLCICVCFLSTHVQEEVGCQQANPGSFMKIVVQLSCSLLSWISVEIKDWGWIHKEIWSAWKKTALIYFTVGYCLSTMQMEQWVYRKTLK